MTIDQTLRNCLMYFNRRSLIHWRKLMLLVIVAVTLGNCLPTTAFAQRGALHHLYQGNMPPGAIGSAQLSRGGPLYGYYQPVEIKVARGASISLAVQGKFERPQPNSVMAGFLIGAVYRLKISQIAQNEGFEVYPTIEIIDRLYPPNGLASRYPIPITISQEELEMALEGRFITRVIYLEPPSAALPVREDPDDQRYFEVRPSQDPLKVADQLGRPVAILRIGSRVPILGNLAEFGGGTPPLLKYFSSNKPREASLERRTVPGNFVRRRSQYYSPLPPQERGPYTAGARGPVRR